MLMCMLIHSSIAMTKPRILIIFLFLSFSTGCNTGEGDFSYPQQNCLNSPINMDIEIFDTMSIDLLSLVSDIKLIRLETTIESVIGNLHSVIVGEGFTFAVDEYGYHLFDSTGRFLSKPFLRGRGPDEVVSPVFSPSIRHGRIWFSDSGKSRGTLFAYEISSGLIEKIPLYEGWLISNIAILSDSTLVVMFNRPSIVKDFLPQGEYFLARFDRNRCMIDSLNLGLQSTVLTGIPSLLITSEEHVFASNSRGDSLFVLDETGLNLVWRNYLAPFKSSLVESQRIVSIKPLFISHDKAIFVRKGYIIKGIGVGVNTSIKPEFLLVDISSGKLTILKPYLLGGNYVVHPYNILQLDEDRICLILNPEQLLDYINQKKSGELCPLFKDLSIERVLSLVTLEDNPYLVIGRWKPDWPL